MSAAMSWQEIDSERPILWAFYGRNNEARCTVVGDGIGGLIVYSPGSLLTDEMVAALQAHGPVRWLLAPNHFHNIGIAKWKRRFPDARIVAGQGAHRRLSRICKETGSVESLSEMSVGPGLDVMEAVGTRQGEVWLSVKTGSDYVWIIGDVFTNTVDRPAGWQGLIWRFVGLGFRVNRFFWTMFARDRTGLKGWIDQGLTNSPPCILVPCHGEIVRDEPAELVRRLRVLLAGVRS